MTLLSCNIIKIVTFTTVIMFKRRQLSMQINILIKFIISAAFLPITVLSYAQTTYLPIQDDVQYLVDRIQTKSKYFGTQLTSGSLPLSRKDAIDYLQTVNTPSNSNTAPLLSLTDQEQINKALATNGEWLENASGMDGMQRSIKPFLSYFYTTTAHFFHYHDDHFFIVANPVLDIQIGKENDTKPLTYRNLRGASIRGSIKNKVGFYTFLADNQERPMQYVLNWESTNNSFPHHDYYRRLSNNTLDAFIGRAFIDFSAFNDKMNISFGYDKNFIGYGTRSLVLSNFSAAATFLRVRTKISKQWHYENLFTELTDRFEKLGNDERLPRKYAAIHQLTWSAKPWLELSVFEANTFHTGPKLPISNMVPIIGFQSILSATGADQASRWGLQFKLIPIKNFQVYGQTMIESLHAKNTTNPNLNNKWAAQIGLKYFDIGGIPNLDLLLEGNYVSAFMYSSQTTANNYSHYNQPLAHPMGANFAEGILQLKYAITSRFEINTTSQISIKGMDKDANENYGGNIFNTLTPTISANNYQWINGSSKNRGMYHQLNIAYELFPSFWIDAGGIYLQTNTLTSTGIAQNKPYQLYGGLRWNIGRSNYLFN